jgi:hypothetical protein
MKKVALIAIALLLGSSVGGYAAPKNAGGASEFSPGDQMRDRGGPTLGSRGASEFSPGDRRRDTSRTIGRGASEFSPGDQKNDLRRRH